MPYPNFRDSLESLDYRRLGKQRVESMQLLMCLRGTGSTGWRNHPAVKMWRGFEDALSNYLRENILQWINRGYKNTMEIPKYKPAPMPKWMGDMDFHRSHQSNLVRKLPSYYVPIFPDVPDNLEYIWPK